MTDPIYRSIKNEQLKVANDTIRFKAFVLWTSGAFWSN